MIDGVWYPTLEQYVEKIDAEEKASIERERAEQRERDERERAERERAEQRAKAERERQEKERREAAVRKERQKKALVEQIHDLEIQRDSAKGLFARMKRNKIQRQIDELNDEVRRL